MREHVPDKNGNVLPGSVTAGTYEIRDLTNKGRGALFEGKVVYDKTYGHVSYGCAGCCAYRSGSFAFFYDPLGISLGLGAWQGVQAYDGCYGDYEDVSDVFYYNWSTGNTAIATVNSYGSHTGMAVGSTTSQTFTNAEVQYGPTLCRLVRQAPSGNDNVKPTISGPNTVWYFNGLNPPGYATSIQLTSSGGASTTWSVTAGANKVNLSTTTGSSTTVTSSAAAFSSAVGDIKVTATVNGQTSVPFSITSRLPLSLAAGTIQTSCDSQFGYTTVLQYTILDQLLTSLPSGALVNESWTTGVVNDFNGTNWGRSPANGVTVPPGATLADSIEGADLGSSPTPVPLCNGDSTAVQHWGQDIRVGSLTIGSGYRVQADTLQKYKGRAAHLAIVSPAP